MKKLMTMVAVLGFAVAGFAAVNDALLTFSTPGQDKYADGTTVLDGECYALVWTKAGAAFAGLKADGTPVAETDKVILVAPVAQGGRCPTIVYQIPAATADALTGGSYGVYLLDTRVKAADGTTALAGFEDGKPVAVNAQAAVGDSTTASSAGQASMAVAATVVGGAAVEAVTIIDVPKITGLKVAGAKIQVTVAGMSPVATYKVYTGSQPGKLETEVAAEAQDGTFTFEKPEGQFFKIIGTRNFK